MDPFTTLPSEIRQVILEELPSLRALQCAVQASRAFLIAYRSSRKLTRQAVFRNEYHAMESEAESGDSSRQTALSRAQYRVEQLAKTSSRDSLILRQALWPLLLANTNIHQGPDATCFLQWSLDLATEYRSESLEKDAREVEMHTLRVISRGNGLAELGLDWLRRTAITCKRHESFNHGQQLLLQAWDGLSGYLKNVSSFVGHRVGVELVECTAMVCRGGQGEMPRRTILARAWKFLQRTSMDWDIGVVCCFCLDAATLLAAVVTGPGEISDVEKTWRDIPPRSPPFAPWSEILVECHTKRLDGVLKIWNRLREVPDPARLEAYDLDWARQVIIELRKQERGQQGSLAFQSSVLALLNPAQPQYYAFGRNLADAYLKNGDAEQAIRVREQMMENTSPTSSVFRSSGLALIALYLKTGRGDDASHLKDEMEKKMPVHPW